MLKSLTRAGSKEGHLFRLKAIMAQYVREGLVPRVHGRVAPNALVLEEVKGIITFVMHYVETNAILLPGRIPGYKRDDIKLLPSSCTKRAVWLLYLESATSLSLRSVARCGEISWGMLWSVSR